MTKKYPLVLCVLGCTGHKLIQCVFFVQMAHNHFAGARLLTKCEKRDGVRELRKEGGEGG